MLTFSTHPSIINDSLNWTKWRYTYDAGDDFRDRYLQKFDAREDDTEFQCRKSLTPVPSFAKTAADEIRNAIFQRMRDITRIGGSESYRNAVNGLDGGVDRFGSTMNAFIGTKLLSELLVMSRVGVYVDFPQVPDLTLASEGMATPYLYRYTIEDIVSWSCPDPEQPHRLHALMLRDHCMEYDEDTLLPSGVKAQYRHLWIGDDGRVHVRFLDQNKKEKSDQITLELDTIPFVMIDIGDSIIKSAADYQIALMNLTSTDVWYALKANFPFYVEQYDPRTVGTHLKRHVNEDGTAATGGQGAADEAIRVGTTQGRRYGKDLNAPAFIYPSPEPLLASMQLQDKYEKDIRKLVHLAVVAMATRASAESKALDNEALNAGLSFIGLVLESAERQIAELWASYENRKVASRKIPTIRYPERYSIKTEEERISEADSLSKLVAKMPSQTAQRELAKSIANTLLNGKVPIEVMTTIEKEIDDSTYINSDPDVILAASEQGLVGEETASIALGFGPDEHLKARKDHAARLARIQEAQTPPDAGNDDRPAARGIPDADPDPNSGSEEREEASDTDESGDKKPPVRGEGK